MQTLSSPRRAASSRLRISNRWYLEASTLRRSTWAAALAWLDTGTHDSLIEASLFIQTLEKRQGLKVACPEEIAYHLGYITAEKMTQLAAALGKSGYGEYLLRVLRGV